MISLTYTGSNPRTMVVMNSHANITDTAMEGSGCLNYATSLTFSKFNLFFLFLSHCTLIWSYSSLTRLNTALESIRVVLHLRLKVARSLSHFKLSWLWKLTSIISMISKWIWPTFEFLILTILKSSTLFHFRFKLLFLDMEFEFIRFFNYFLIHRR